jgi:outer membrane protein OmpA-like peptidoglycan-associated protein
MSQLSKAEKTTIIIATLICGIIIASGVYFVHKKINISALLNGTISTMKQSATEKKNQFGNELHTFKSQMGESLLHQEKQQVTIFFNINESRLSKDSLKELQKIISFNNTHKNCVVSLFGYTDKSGTDNINIPLSITRTETVKQYLIKNGIKNIQSVGYGNTKDSRSVDIIIANE